MGAIRITIRLENPETPGHQLSVDNVLVDTGAELSWMPANTLTALGIVPRKAWSFRQADGTVIERETGFFAILYAAGTMTIDEVVFGHENDLVLLGARTIEGLNLRVEPVTKRLVDAGPAPAAAAA